MTRESVAVATTMEAFRALQLHASFRASPEIQLPNEPWFWNCDGCDKKLSDGGTGRETVFAGLAIHQVDMLGEAGLLRPEPPPAPPTPLPPPEPTYRVTGGQGSRDLGRRLTKAEAEELRRDFDEKCLRAGLENPPTRITPES